MADRNTILVAVDVIAGDYGNGNKRFDALRKKGYDPTIIQNEVNVLLSESKKKSVDVLAHEVIDGLWRSGDKRKKVLTACGCNYDAVQKRVNEILDPQDPKPYQGVIPTTKLVKTPAEVIADALAFGKWIVNDNRFGYGRMGGSKYKGTTEYGITHSGGCHFCGSNAHKISEAKKAGLKNPTEWEYTYVCNTFVHACYAHAGVPSMLSAKGHAWWIKSYQGSKYWQEIKKPSKITELKAGDVLAWGSNGGTSGHFCMYIGNGKGMEATSNGLGSTFTKAEWAKSIRICDFSRHFKAATHVFRFVGTINTSANIRYGEVSSRVADLQRYLKRYGIDLADDRLFGDATLEAVKRFQKDQGIAVDGIVGSATIAKMKSVRK